MAAEHTATAESASTEMQAQKASAKHGFTSPQSLKRKENVINVAKLDEIAVLSTETEKGKTHVNLTTMGYTKLLGTGKITKPLTVTVPACSKTAEEKIKKAGGQVLTASQENGE